MHVRIAALVLSSLALATACGGRTTGQSTVGGDEGADARVPETRGDAAEDVMKPLLQSDASSDPPVASHVPSECILPGGSSSTGTGTDLSCEQGGCQLCAPESGNCPSASFTNCCVYNQDGMVWSNWFYDPAPSAIAYQQSFCETTSGAWYPATP